MRDFLIASYEIQAVATISIKLLISIALGALLGWERERHGRAAGLRTHMLLCLGATLFTVISLNVGTDSSRIAAQVVSGIGFIGAGAILRQGNEIRGLTSATSLWAAAAIGMAVGVGGAFFYIALIATLLGLLTLSLVNRIAHRIAASHPNAGLRILVTQPGATAEVFALLTEANIIVIGFRQDIVMAAEASELVITTRNTTRELEAVLPKIAQRPDVAQVELDTVS